MPKVTGKTYVDPEKVLEVVRRSGLETLEQKAFIKVTGAGGRRLYVAKTKGVGRIDISGFEMPANTPGIKSLGDASHGAVSQEIEFEGREEDQVLSTLERVLKAMRPKASRPHRGSGKQPTARA